MIRLAQERGWDPADTKAALDGWVQRMAQSMAVASSSAGSSATDRPRSTLRGGAPGARPVE